MTASTRLYTPPGGKVITFYSYKGGTGRTMALANVAWILASNGYRVLVIDWDLESPGLHRFFHPMLADPQLHASEGVIDMVREYAEAALIETAEAAALPAPDVRRYAVSLDWEFPEPGCLDLLPAGKQGPAYSRTVNTFDWSSFYDRLNGVTYLTNLRHNIREYYDYVLIDSRTGLSDSAGICTVLLPDILVDCFTLNTQGIDGASSVARSVQKQRAEELRVLPVRMRVEEGEQGKLEAGRDYAWRRFAPFLRHLAPDALSRYWAEIEVPYKVFYAYEEILAVFGDRAGQPTTLLAAYERLTRVITDGRVDCLPPMDESDRRRGLTSFERSPLHSMDHVVIAYVPENQMWADWITGVLEGDGLATMAWDAASSDWDQSPDATADPIIILLSAAYRREKGANEFLRQALALEDSETRVIPISIDGSPPPTELDRPWPLELSGMSFERAHNALREALNWPPGSPPSPLSRELAGQLRYPGTQPTVFRLPSRNPTFTGRDRLLTMMRQRLVNRSPIALTGLGGIGKTQIAIEYAHRFASDYDIVWHVFAAQSSTLRAGLVDLADKLGIPAADTITERISLLMDALAAGRPYSRWLLIFDNVRHPESLKDILRNGTGQVLVTSRSPEWGRVGDVIEVRPFGRNESVGLLQLRMPALAAEEADQVAELLGDLPLAIEQAGSWLATTGMPVDRYFTLVKYQLSRLLTENPPTGYEQASQMTWLLSLNQMREESPAAARLVELLAFFGADPIPASLIYSHTLIDIVAGDDSALRDDANFGRLITQVSRFALASFDDTQGSVQMHRLVQTVIREDLSSEAAEQCRRHVHEILVAAVPTDSERPETWPVFAKLLPHIVPSRALHSTDDKVCRLVLDAVRFLFLRGDYAGSAELAEATIRAWERHWPSDELRVLTAKVFLANSQRARGDYVAARQLDEQAHVGLMRTVGPQNQYTVMCVSGLAADLWAAAEYGRARELNEEALSASRELFGPTHRGTFRAMNNLGVLMEQIGDYEEALRLHERAYRGRRHTLGELSPDTLFSATSYGRVLRLTGDLRGSWRMLASGLAHHKDIHGDDHAATLRASVELSATLRRVGELAEAHSLGRDVFNTYTLTRRPTHADRLACANTLALTLSARGDHREAMGVGMESADRHADAFGEEHPFTLAVRSNVAIFLRRAGELDAARRLADSVVARLTTVLGRDHPNTLQCSVIAANALAACGEYAAARELEQYAYDHMIEALGRRHPDRIIAGCNLAATRQAMNETEGIGTFRNTLEVTAVQVLGRGHPIIAVIHEGERGDCEIDLSQLS